MEKKFDVYSHYDIIPACDSQADREINRSAITIISVAQLMGICN